MNIRAILHALGFMLMVVGLAMTISWGVGVAHGDSAEACLALAGAALLTMATGLSLALFFQSDTELALKDGIMVVTVGWFIACLFGALPYLWSGVIHDPISAVFETVSGFTTTGASVLGEIDSLPKGLLFWRALTHFLGGMGVLVLCVAVLPFLRAGGMQIYRAEVTGPSKDRLTPRIANTAKLLWGVYLLLCVLATLLLRLCGMSWFDATCHAFATVATGGFSTRTASIAAYDNIWIEVVTIVFMLLGATSFVLHMQILRGRLWAYFRDGEWRLFAGIWVGACLLVAFTAWRDVFPDFHEALHHSAFAVTSLYTTTGFATVNYDQWPLSSRFLLLMLMVVGGCTGSTAGGIKQMRLMAIIKSIIRESKLFMRPNAVIPLKIGREIIPDEVGRSMLVFFVLYLAGIVLGTLAMCPFMPDLLSAISAVIATLGGVGPGMGMVGPMCNYGGVAPFGKAILILLMLLGRLEFYTLLVLLFPSYWRR